MDVETLMQEIKQWGPQDQAGPPVDGRLRIEPGSQTPPRGVSPHKAEQSGVSPSPSHSLTPNQSSIHEEPSSSSEKVRGVHCNPFTTWPTRICLPNAAVVNALDIFRYAPPRM